ncbi:MAG: choline kinase family protein [Dongiaceae bacterium]
MPQIDPSEASDLSQALAQIPALATVPPAAWSVARLGGVTNRNYRLRHERLDYVLRLPGAGAHLYLDREAGFHNAALAAAIGIAPPVLFSDTARGWQLSVFLPDAVMLQTTDFHDLSILAAIGRVIGRLQASGVDFRNEMHPFAISDRYLALAPESRLLALRRQAAWLETALEGASLPLVPSHIDPNPSNFLLQAGDHLSLIDWEFSAMADPCWDLAAIALDNDLSSSEIDCLLAAAGYPLNEDMVRRLLQMRTALCLVASSWAFVEIAAGNDAPDLRDFAEQRLAAFAAGLAPA